MPVRLGPRGFATESPSRSCCSCPRFGRTRTVTGCCGRGRSPGTNSGIGSLAIVGAGRDEKYLASLTHWRAELGIAEDVVFVGGVPLEETVSVLPGG